MRRASRHHDTPLLGLKWHDPDQMTEAEIAELATETLLMIQQDQEVKAPSMPRS